jgi:hypothetical protein
LRCKVYRLAIDDAKGSTLSVAKFFKTNSIATPPCYPGVFREVIDHAAYALSAGPPFDGFGGGVNQAANLVNDRGVQLAAISYPDMLAGREMTNRGLREGVEFFRFLRTHEA